MPPINVRPPLARQAVLPDLWSAYPEGIRAAAPDATPGDVFSDVMTDHGYRIPAIRVAENRGTFVRIERFTRATHACGIPSSPRS